LVLQLIGIVFACHKEELLDRDVDLGLGLEARKWHGLGLEPLALASASELGLGLMASRTTILTSQTRTLRNSNL
jgi:hypothetical protein